MRAFPKRISIWRLNSRTRATSRPALVSVRRSLEIKETPANQALFVRIAAQLDVFAEDSGLRALVTRAVTEGWPRAADLAPLATTLVKSDIRAGDPLLRWLLESGPICDLAVEAFLSASRAGLLDAAEKDDDTARE